MRTLRLSRKVKVELVSAVVMALVFLSLSVLLSRRQQLDEVIGSQNGYHLDGMRTSDALNALPAIQQTIYENIQGELKTGSFETVIKGLRNFTDYYKGNMPYLNMQYENGLWNGNANCKIPTENVTDFTIDVRQLISDNGKVTHISVTVTEEEVNQTAEAEVSMSTITIGLKEVGEGDSPVSGQISAAFSWLVNPLIWVAEGLMIILPLSFICLGVVMLFDRGIVPLWKKQLRNKNTGKPGL